jgi:hypothetical protein
MAEITWPWDRSRFCLVLMRRMADYQPGLVEDAVRELGFSRTDMRETNARWQRTLRGGGAGQAYQRALGARDTVRRQVFGDLTAEASGWGLPLWPGLRFEVLRGPDGRIWHEWLVREGGEPEFTPWGAVVGDVERAYGPVKHLEGSAPSRWSTVFSREGEMLKADFVWGLLQQMETAGVT